MKKLLFFSASSFLSIMATGEIRFVDLEKVAEMAQITSDVRRQADDAQRKLQADHQKLNEFQATAQKELSKEYEAAASRSPKFATNQIAMDELKIKEFDYSAEIEAQKCKLQGEQSKMQLVLGNKVKVYEAKIRSWAEEFAKSKGYDGVVDKKAFLFAGANLDVTSDFVLFCDKQYLKEKKTGELLASAGKTTSLDLGQKNTTLAKNTSVNASGETVA